ncbi:predicted protein [Histoplasma capsulatum H143]|uniref:Uncharacterized protein n=1 Tax=Ajellomyces capsulatus (strain H143) TaxID=544712 RepID=C6HDG2_AJECH|nr:predicted protein [Histoplasma capsulatum H143]
MDPQPTPLDCKFGKMSFCHITRSETPITLGDSVFYTVEIEAPIDPDIIGDVVLKATTNNGLDYDIIFRFYAQRRPTGSALGCIASTRQWKIGLLSCAKIRD